jgi:hypothetical protein
MNALSLSAAAYGEIKEKFKALGLEKARIRNEDGLEFLDVGDFILTCDKENGEGVIVYLAYKGKLIKTPKGDS